MRWGLVFLALVTCAPSIQGAPCLTDENCPTSQICVDERCEFGPVTGAMTDGGGGGSCDTTNQPWGCGYGSACANTGQCNQIVDATCTHIANASGRTSWTSASTGPVVFNIVNEVDVATDCTTGNAFTMTVYAYAGTTPFPAQVSALPRLFVYSSTGAGVDITGQLPQASYSIFNGGAQMGVTFSQCSTETARLDLGLAFVGGNGVCTTQTR